jgi:hypothetical protein
MANKEMKEDEPIMPGEAGDNEAGDLGDEQLPAGGTKTGKEEWNYAADKVKREPILPERVREFLAGL